MKILQNTAALMITVVCIGIGNGATAQHHGKAPAQKKEKQKHDSRAQSSRYNYDTRWEYEHPHWDGGKYHTRPTHNGMAQRRLATYRAPRYVYYRDYDVYFDRDRRTYISRSGRRWVPTTRRPVSMRGLDMTRVVTLNVDFHDDNLDAFLLLRRPAYAEIRVAW